jgi:nucleotide-binding universal stress UspA family protein
MSIRKLLLPLQTATTAQAAFSTAVIVARLWCAHLVVLHVTGDKSRGNTVRDIFTKLVSENNLTVADQEPDADKPTVSFSVAVGKEAEIVAQQARLADLIVLPHPASGGEVSSSEALHAVLFDSARPVLIAPLIAPPTLGTHICLAWNGSAESASAIFAALPWLPRAQAIRILWAEEYQRRGPFTQDLETYLAAHGITTGRAMFRPINNSVGAGLLTAANEFACDLLVMGAYSHSRLRQLFLGGVTRHVLENANVPLMMHR